MFKTTIEEIISIPHAHFRKGEMTSRYAFFSAAEIVEMKTRIAEFKASKDSDKVKRTGGSALEKKLSRLETLQSDMLNCIEEINGILAPDARKRLTVAEIKEEAAAEAKEATRQQNIALYAKLDSKTLRALATAAMGDAALDFIDEELPIALANFQTKESKGD